MKVVAVIPARGNSKGIHRKNLRLVMGMTLVQRSIHHALECSSIDRVLVTSDDDEILDHALACGAEPIKRPDNLATDEANGDDVIVHALQAIDVNARTVPDEHITVFLQPTSPIRPSGLIDECLRTLYLPAAPKSNFEAEWRYDSVFTAYEGHFAWRIVSDRWNPERAEEYRLPRAVSVGHQKQRLPRQDIPLEQRVYIENGCVYATKTFEFLALRVAQVSRPGEHVSGYNRLCGRIGIVMMDREDSIDIDTEYDLWLAEQRLRYVAEKRQEVEA